jgi:hypothetical protein
MNVSDRLWAFASAFGALQLFLWSLGVWYIWPVEGNRCALLGGCLAAAATLCLVWAIIEIWAGVKKGGGGRPKDGHESGSRSPPGL